MPSAFCDLDTGSGVVRLDREFLTRLEQVTERLGLGTDCEEALVCIIMNWPLLAPDRSLYYVQSMGTVPGQFHLSEALVHILINRAYRTRDKSIHSAAEMLELALNDEHFYRVVEGKPRDLPVWLR